MLKSMTAYGRSQLKFLQSQITVEIQSLNRKHLDIHVHLPAELNYLEIEVKKWIGAIISRGSIVVKVLSSFEKESPFQIVPNLLLARQAKSAWEEISEDLKMDKHSFSLSMLANIPDILLTKQDAQFDEVYRSHLKMAIDGALNDLTAMKYLEGGLLQIDLLTRVNKMMSEIKLIEEKAPLIVAKYREKLTKRLEELSLILPEHEDRILREIALFAEKIDITEEIVRFSCHLVRFKDLIQSSHESIGKTLEFILQELLREVNTISSKSSDLNISLGVIEIKSEIEKMREQVQNIE